MQEKRLILFDYDGVIVDSLTHNVKIAKACSRALGFDFFPPLDDIRNMDNMTFENLGMLMGFSKAQSEIFLRCVFDRLNARVEALATFPGIGRLLKILAREYILAVVTANREAGVLKLLALRGLKKYVSAVAGSDRPGAKSDKALALMKQYTVPKERVYLMGDTVSDIEEARKAGVNSIAVTWGFQKEDRLLSRRPDFLFHNPEEIEDFFMKSH